MTCAAAFSSTGRGGTSSEDLAPGVFSGAFLMTKENMVQENAPKSGMESLIDKLRKTKKKPSDWVFVPRRKKFDKGRVMLEDGEAKLVGDGSGGFKTHRVRPPLTIRIQQFRSVSPSGEVMGGYRPADEGSWKAEEVLEAMLEMSCKPECEIVPYEAREMGKEAKDAEMGLITERKLRMDAEEKLKALEDGDAAKERRIQELEAQVKGMKK